MQERPGRVVTRECITNWSEVRELHPVDRPRPCTRRGVHFATCENPDDCRGCAPRTAIDGSLLCPVCTDRINDLLPRLGWLIAHLRSIEKPAQAIGERVDTSTERSILIPDSWVAADGLMTAMGGRVIPSTASIDDAVRLAHDAADRFAQTSRNNVDWAVQAVTLLRRVTVALRRWPDSDAEIRPIPHMKCPACGWDHLWRQGPAKQGDDERVICGTEGCGYSFPFLLWTAVNAPEFARLEADMKRREQEAV